MVKGLIGRFHTFENCSFWNDRIGRCPYCDSGSKPVDKSVIIKNIDRQRFGGVKLWVMEK